MDRTPISQILNEAASPLDVQRIEENTPNFETGDWFGIYDRNGKLIAAVQEDDLFDPDGNRFYMDE